MKKTSLLFSAAVSALLLVGCGGGGTETPASPTPAPTPAPTPTPPPTNVSIDTPPSATLAAKDATTARSLAADVQKGAEDAVQTATLPRAPGGIELLPGGVSETYQCADLYGPGGSGSVSYSAPDTPVAQGWQATFTYNNCAFSSAGYSFVYNGTLSWQYTRYVSNTDFAFQIRAQNFTFSYSYNGQVITSGTYNYSYTYDVHNGSVSITYSTANGAAVANLSVTRSGSNVTVNGTYVVNWNSGVVRVVFNQWTYNTTNGHPVSGSVHIVGANGTTVDVVASASGYTVTYTAANGAQTVYTVSY